MSTARRLRDSGFVDPRSLPRGPSGRALCRRCGTEVPPRRRTFCSAACVHEWRLRSDPGYARRAVEQRDAGVCAACGVDTRALERDVRRALAVLTKDAEWTRTRRVWEDGTLVRRFRRPLRRALRARAARPALRALEAAGLAADRSFWEADHVVAVVEGGGLCGLDNLRTLCRPCHRAATRALRSRRTIARAA
jgi:5-methylcytosine-specific restriction enzyme A